MSQHATAAQSPRWVELRAGSPDPDSEPRTHLQGGTEAPLRHDDPMWPTRAQKRMVRTDHDVSSPSRKVGSGLQRGREAGHCPLAVSGVSCRGSVQHQIPDAPHKPGRTLTLRLRKSRASVPSVKKSRKARPSLHRGVSLSVEPAGETLTATEAGTPPAYNGAVRRVRSRPDILLD